MTTLTLYKLPPEILINIFKRLNKNDLRNLMITCKYLRDFILNEGNIWKYICRENLILLNKSSSSLSFYNRCRISYNWCKGIFKSKLIIQHSINYIPWMQLVSDVLILSVGPELKCYAIDKTGYNRGLLWGITVPMTHRERFIVKNNLIICGNRDGCTTVYKYYDIHVKPILLNYIENCHEGGQVEVTAVESWNGSIITASNVSPSLALWLRKDEMLNRTTSNSVIDGMHEITMPACVGCRSLAVDPTETKLAIGPNGNSKPYLVDINVGQCIMAAEPVRELKHVIRDINWHQENGIIYVSHSGRLQYTDTRTGKVVYDTMDPFQSSLYCSKNDNNKAVIVGSSEYSRCVLFDLRSPHHVQLYFTQKKSSPIYSLDFDASKLIAAADRSVAVINFNVNSSTAKIKDYSQLFEFVT